MTKYVQVAASIKILDEEDADIAALELADAIRDAISDHPAPSGVHIRFTVADQPIEFQE
jgi:hypothetical protein